VCFAFKNNGICSVLCISGLKSIGIYSIFCVFALFPQKTLKRKNAVIYSILLLLKRHLPDGKTHENTMAVKDGEASNCAQKLPNATSEPHRK